jgi:hypothetical protein
MGKEVEMVDAPEAAKATADQKPSEPQPPSVQEQLAGSVKLIEKAVRQKDTRLLFSKVLRQAQAVRRQLTPHDLAVFARSVLPEGSSSLALLLDNLALVSL